MVVIDGKEVMVADIATAKSGKHGAAKTFVSYIDPSTGVKKDKVISGNEEVQVVTTS
jgi:translation elongation factor P/translation initiation factor 5A